MINIKCTYQLKNELADFSLIGQWYICRIEYPEQFNGQGSTIKNTSFFGITAWSKSIDKQFTFTSTNKCSTDILSDKIVDLRYRYVNEDIFFNLILDDEIIENGFEVKMKIEDSNTIKWTLDDLIEVYLSKKD